MRSYTRELTFNTKDEQSILNITEKIQEELEKSGIKDGFCLISSKHNTSSIFVNDEDPGFWQDIHDFMEEIAPWEEHPGTEEDYLHNRESENNAAAHFRSLLFGNQTTIPITDRNLDLGPWQQIIYGEWDGERPKQVIVKIIGE